MKMNYGHYCMRAVMLSKISFLGVRDCILKESALLISYKTEASKCLNI